MQQALALEPRGFCFVVGTPRAGTSAVSRWLNGQPGVVYASQSRVLVAAHRLLEQVERFRTLNADRDALLAATRRLVSAYYARSWLCWRRLLVDKENLEPVAIPDARYDAFVASARALFPAARLLFMVREPLPTVWSITRRRWGHSLTRPTLRSYSTAEAIAIWCAGAELALRFTDDPGAYLCRFERLVGEPEVESRRIGAFLGIRVGHAFQPRPTKVVGFGEGECEQVRRATTGLHERLLVAARAGSD
jgi:hypothetical protein